MGAHESRRRTPHLNICPCISARHHHHDRDEGCALLVVDCARRANHRRQLLRHRNHVRDRESAGSIVDSEQGLERGRVVNHRYEWDCRDAVAGIARLESVRRCNDVRHTRRPRRIEDEPRKIEHDLRSTEPRPALPRGDLLHSEDIGPCRDDLAGQRRRARTDVSGPHLVPERLRGSRHRRDERKGSAHISAEIDIARHHSCRGIRVHARRRGQDWAEPEEG